jgi:hypothetical protein
MKIKDEDEYQILLDEFEHLHEMAYAETHWHLNLTMDEAERYDELAKALEEYENIHYPIDVI